MNIAHHHQTQQHLVLKANRARQVLDTNLMLTAIMILRIKKLINVKPGTNNDDVVIKSQIQYLDGVLKAQVTNNKAVIYSPSGSIHTNDLFLRDKNGQEVHFYNEDQDLNQCRLYVPNLKNNDSYGGRLKSSVVVTSINQTIEGKKIFHDIEVPTPTIDGHSSNKAYVDNEISKISDDSNYVKKSGDTMSGPLIVPKDSFPIQGSLDKVISYETQREIFLSRRESFPINADLNMNGFTIDNLKTPTAADHSCNKGYVDSEISKLQTIDTTQYLKKDGSIPLEGNLDLNGNRILRLPDPQLADEPATLGFVSKLNNDFFNSYLDLKGVRKMEGNLQMNGNIITGLSNSPSSEYEATSKKYVDDNITKASIKPSHTPKNAFKYLMSNVNEWSTEYNIKVGNFIDLADSPHPWDKRVLSITPIKDGKNYRFRLGIQAFPLKMNQLYSLVVELYNRDYETWLRQETYIQGTGVYIKNHNTTKFQHQYSSSGDLYYSKTLIIFRKTSSGPNQIYFTIHYDDKGGDLNTYPNEFSNQVYIIAYGIIGETNHINPEVYDAHQAYEIDKTKMKMLVPLDMNNKKLTNVPNPINSSDGCNKEYADQAVNKLDAIFEITDTSVRILKNLDMNSKNIKNIANITPTIASGLIDIIKNFVISNIVFQYSNIYITNIKIMSSSAYINQDDFMYIHQSGLYDSVKIVFRHPSKPSFIKLDINLYFNNITRISLSKGRNLAFIIEYKPIY